MRYKNTQKKSRSAEFLHFSEGETKEIEVNGWEFGRGTGGYLFKTYVDEENGEKVDKIWTVWDYESVQELKKKLRGADSVRLKVKMSLNDDDEQSFEFL